MTTPQSRPRIPHVRFTIDDRILDWDGRLLVSEGIAVKKVAGLTPLQVMQSMEALDPEALRALIWVLRTRTGEKVKLSDVDFDIFGIGFDQLDADGNVVPPEPADTTPEGPGNGDAPDLSDGPHPTT